MLEGELLEKLRRIQRLFAGATTEGERAAAAAARDRIQARMAGGRAPPPSPPQPPRPVESPINIRFRADNPWSRRLLLALLQRHGLEHFRKRGQRRSTVMARMTRTFCDEVLWPEYLALDEALRARFEEVTKRTIAESLFPRGGRG